MRIKFLGAAQTVLRQMIISGRAFEGDANSGRGVRHPRDLGIQQHGLRNPADPFGQHIDEIAVDLQRIRQAFTSGSRPSTAAVRRAASRKTRRTARSRASAARAGSSPSPSP